MTTEKEPEDEPYELADVEHHGFPVVWVVTKIPVGGWPAGVPRPLVLGFNILIAGENGYAEAC